MQNNIKVLLLDFSYTLCFPKTEENIDSLNGHYKEIMNKDSKVNPLDSFIINQELLDYLRSLKSQYKIYVFTSGFMHTDPLISQYLKPVFDGYITSNELGLPKSFPDAYKVIANRLGINVDQIFFIDDQRKNVESAITAGAQAVQFINNDDVINKLDLIKENSFK